MKDELFNIDKKSFFNLITKKEKYHYLYNLYKVYDLANKLTDNNLTKTSILKEKEDQIYTVNGSVLSERQRILIELKRIAKALKTNKDSINKENISKIAKLLIPVIDTANNKEIEETTTYEKTKDGIVKKLGLRDIKENIAEIEAMLDLPINFLYEGAIAFLSSTACAYLDEMDIITDNKIKNVRFQGFENSVLKDENIKLVNKKEYSKYDNNEFIIKGASK